jgi:hypothetical protein
MKLVPKDEAESTAKLEIDLLEVGVMAALALFFEQNLEQRTCRFAAARGGREPR